MRRSATPIWLVVLVLAAVFAAGAKADRQLPANSLAIEVLGADGQPDTAAGTHPDRFIALLHIPEDQGRLVAKRGSLDFPAGMAGDPAAVPACPREVFDALQTCPPESQVGIHWVVRSNGDIEARPLYSIEPAPGEVMTFGSSLPGFAWNKFASRLRPDLTLNTQLLGLPQLGGEGIDPLYTFVENRLEFWGIPADHQVETSIPRRPLLTLPTRCDVPLTVKGQFLLWQRGDEPFDTTATTGMPLTGCDKLSFAPSVSLAMDRPVSDSPTSLDIAMRFAQNADPVGLAASQVKAIDVELPAGLALSPVAASTLGVCTDADFGLGSEREAACPPVSRIGSVEIEAPQLQTPLVGKVYFGQEHPDQRFRLFVVASGGGVEAKLVSAMRADPASGRLVTSLEDLPQVSLGRMALHFDGGSRALFLSPLECGRATVDASFAPYSGAAVVHASAGVDVQPRPGKECGAKAPFEPTLRVATSSSRGGGQTSLTAVIGRREGEQLLDRFRLALPTGFSARLGGVERCGDAGIAAAACPAGSRIGSGFAAFGSGAESTEIDGGAYLTGPYRGSPLGFAMVLRGAIGSFDLGSIVLRGGLDVNPVTGEVSVRSSSVPSSFEGIPIRLQRLGLQIDQPGFLRAPTSCGPKRMEATVVSASGAVASPVAEIDLSHCIDLPFRPSASVRLIGRSQLHLHGRPGLRIAIRARRQDANLRAISLRLPAALRFDESGIEEICSRREALRGTCPKSSRVGVASGRSPLFDKPLSGAVYVAQPKGDGPPDLWASLAGEGVRLSLQGRSSIEDGHLATRFSGLPDVPLSTLSMRLNSGRGGLLSLARRLCVKRHERGLVAPLSLEAQNAALRALRIDVSAPDACRPG